MPAKKFKKIQPSKVAKKAKVMAKKKVKATAGKKLAKTRIVKKKTGGLKKPAATKIKKPLAKAVLRAGKAASGTAPGRKDKIKPARSSGMVAHNVKIANGYSPRMHGVSQGTRHGLGTMTTVKNRTKTAPVKLSKSELEHFRNLLLEKRRQILGDVGSMESEAFHNQDSHSSSPMHMADVGTDNFEQEFTLGLIESERQLLKEIQEAIGRIEDGIFGICVATGKPIGKARLEAKPWASHCIEYARMMENGGLSRNGGHGALQFADEED